jgi:hypothetical protein
VNVYKLMGDSMEKRWARFYPTSVVTLPTNPLDEAAFFEAHPRIAIERDIALTPIKSKAALSDFSFMATQPIFSERARTAFAEHMEGLGNWIELDCTEGRYSLFFLTNIVDALDEAGSSIARFGDGTRVMRIASHAFLPEKVRGQVIFTLPQLIRSHPLVTDEFVKVVRKFQLTGFLFEPLWSAEKGSSPSDIKDWEKPRLTGLV